MLKGERVLLRPVRQDDVARQHEFTQDHELYGLDCAAPRVSSLEKAQALMDLQNRHGNLELGVMIGDCTFWGRGYGREVVRLLLDYGFCYLGARRIALTTNAKNERAIRCYLACGFVEEGRP